VSMATDNKFNIPTVDLKSKDAIGELESLLKMDHSSADWSNDRNRPYIGQPWTSEGERGKQQIRGVTMRDLKDCIVQGFLKASGVRELQNKTVEINEEFIGTEYAASGEWRTDDVYKIPDDIDPLAVVNNALSFVEHYMGIFPNLPKDSPTPEDIINKIKES